MLCRNSVEGFKGYEKNLPSNFPPYNPHNIELLPYKKMWTGRNYTSDRTIAPVITDPCPARTPYKPWLLDNPLKVASRTQMISGYDPTDQLPANYADRSKVSNDYTRLAAWLGQDYIEPVHGWLPWEK